MQDFLQEDYEILSDIREDGTDRKWKERKLKSLDLASVFDEIEYKKIAKRVGMCADVLEFKKENNRLLLKKTWFCKNKLCPLCNWRRSLKHSYQSSLVIDKALKEYPKARFIFLTLTVKNVSGEELNGAVSNLTKSFDRLFKRVKVKKSLIGYIRNIEVTRNDEREDYHPHIHILMMVKTSYFNKSNYITQEEWSEMWSKSLVVDYSARVDVRVVKPNKDKGLIGAVKETAKYPMKPIKLDLNSQDTYEIVKDIFDGLYRKRQIGYGGILKKIHKELRLENVENGDLVSIGDEQTDTEGIKIIARWSKEFNNYLVKRNS